MGVLRDPRVNVIVSRPPNFDAFDVWVLRYNWPDDAPAWAEILTDDGWVPRDVENQLDTPTLRIDGRALHEDKPLDIALTGLHKARRDLEDRIERLVEGSVMRALAGTPAWFPLHEFPDGRLAVIVKEADE